MNSFLGDYFYDPTFFTKWQLQRMIFYMQYPIDRTLQFTHPVIEEPVGSTGSHSWTARDQNPETIFAVPKLMAELAVAPTSI